MTGFTFIECDTAGLCPGNEWRGIKLAERLGRAIVYFSARIPGGESN